jgi:hypothetical protein
MYVCDAAQKKMIFIFIIAPTVSQTFSHPRIHGYLFIEQYIIEILKHRGRAAIGANFYIISYIS